MASSVFINSQVFTKDADFIIGGFETDKTEGITFTDIYFAFRDRASKFLQDYIEETCALYANEGIENPMEEAIMSAACVIYDNLNITPEYFGKEFLLQAIMNCDSAEKWLFDIEENIKDYKYDNISSFNSIANFGMNNRDLEEYMRVKELVQNTNFSIFIEELSMIES